MLPKYLFVLAQLLYVAVAVNLYVSSYVSGSWAGNVTTLSLLQEPDGSYALSQVTTLNTSTNSPSWLTLNKQNNVLYMIDEATASPNATLVTYKTNYTGELTEITRLAVPPGGVFAEFYASGSAIAVPHYTGSLLVTYRTNSSGGIDLLETFNFSTSAFKLGPIQPNQNAPHPHEAILDPREQFIVVPDLGMDVVHIFSINQTTLELTQLTPLALKPGTGPRHGAFSLDPIAGSYYFYLAGELSGNVTVYRVGYDEPCGDITFNLTAEYTTLPDNESYPLKENGASQASPSEVTITPDGSTLLVANRNDTSFSKPLEIDSIMAYSISPRDGSLTKLGIFSADGSFPRHFSLNRAGNLIAIASQINGTVSVKERNCTSGLYDKEVASIAFPEGTNEPDCVIWDD